MRRFRTAAVLLVIGRTALAGGQIAAPQIERFPIVSGRSYEGAIIPASLVPDWFKATGVTSTWTPTAADVALTEARMVRYLELAVKDLSQVSPRPEFGGGQPPYTLEGLRELVGQLPAYKRQYIGLAYGDRRRLLVNGLPDLARHNWRQRVVIVVDGGCGYWHFDFDLQERRAVRFWCQGSP
jgi:hypothetical protein